MQLDADRLALYASTSGVGNDPVIATITATWTIPAERFASLGPDPLVSVLFVTRSVVRLRADDDNFRAALALNATGSVDGTEIGTAAAPVLQHANADGGHCEDYNPERATLGFGGPIDDGDDVVISFAARCEAIPPSFAFTDSADCRGTRSQQATIELREARVTFLPGE